MKKNNTLIFKQIEIDKSHITDFVLDSDVGTKRMKEKFHTNAVNERNEYVNKQIDDFTRYQKQVYCELMDRMNNLLPTDYTLSYDNKTTYTKRVKSLINLCSNKLSNNYKLGFSYLLSSIDDEISLCKFNKILIKYLDMFKEMGIVLKITDFNYSMFTSQYMDVFFKNMNREDFLVVTKQTFEKIYFECPNIIIHFKYNLVSILKKYEKNISKYLDVFITKSLNKDKLNKSNVNTKYSDEVKKLFWKKEADEYYNLNNFLTKKKNVNDYLEGAAVRNSNFNLFANNGDFSSTSDIYKTNFRDVMREFYGTLLELKEYYRYEFIISDLLKRYKDKDSIKVAYQAKTKECDTEDKNREKIYKDYLKACKKGLFKKSINTSKVRVLKLRMNEEVAKISNLDKELKELTITNILSLNLNDASSIYDLFSNCLLTYSYLESMFNTKFSEDEGYNLEKEFDRFFDFLYNPYNNFLIKINGLVEFDIASIITDKYRLLGLNIDNGAISLENIDTCLDNVRFIMTVYNVSESKLPLKKMAFICNVKGLDIVSGYENANVEII